MGGPSQSDAPPSPLSGLRSHLLRKAWLSEPKRRTETLSMDGFSVVLGASFPSPAPRWGWSPRSFTGRHLDVRSGERFLELGTGCGLVALHAARRGAEVAATDWDPEALRCVRRSFLLAGLGEPRLEEADGLGSFAEETFDAIAWCSPFLPGSPSSSRERRFLSPSSDSVLAQLEELSRPLRRGGRLLFPYPDRDAGSWLGAGLTALGLRYCTLVYQCSTLTGPVRLYRAWRPSESEQAGEVEPGSPLAGAAWILRDR